MSQIFPILACLLLTLLAGPAHATTENYQRGVTAFEKSDWPTARTAFEAVIDKDQSLSSDLLFNLGNTLFRENQPGRAALWYQRALLLDPRDTAARQNLRLLQRRTGSLSFPPPTGQTVAALMKHDAWRWTATGAAWASALALAALVCLQFRGTPRTALWILLAVSLASTAFSVWGANARLDSAEVAARAIITQPETSALAAPTDTAGVIIDLPPGSEVRIKESREKWSFVEIPGEPLRVGWIRTPAATALWPYPPTLVQ
jgi:tetratricopeptide (TPR) repeat protein